MDELRLTRRDALTAVAASGTLAGISLAVSEAADEADSQQGDSALSDTDIATAEAVATVVYPTAVDVTTAFIETYLRRLSTDRKAALSDTVEALNAHTQSSYGASFHEIDDRSKRDAVLRSLGVNRARSVSTGSVQERVRYHLVNSLLYALFTTPKGSRLVGVENPTGYPGGSTTELNYD